MAQLVQTLSDNTHQNFYEDIRMQGVTCLCSLIIGGGGERERERMRVVLRRTLGGISD